MSASSWWAPAGREMSQDDWNNGIARCIGVVLNDGIPDIRPFFESDVRWLRPDGEAMTDEDWAREDTRALAVFLNGREIDEQDAAGREIQGHSFLLLINAHHEPVSFTLPAPSRGSGWTIELSTSDPNDDGNRTRVAAIQWNELPYWRAKTARRVVPARARVRAPLTDCSISRYPLARHLSTCCSSGWETSRLALCRFRGTRFHTAVA